MSDCALFGIVAVSDLPVRFDGDPKTVVLDQKEIRLHFKILETKLIAQFPTWNT